jgi:hypothetical protein
VNYAAQRRCPDTISMHGTHVARDENTTCWEWKCARACCLHFIIVPANYWLAHTQTQQASGHGS